MTTQEQVIDADSHIEEPDELWDYIEAGYRARRPRMVDLRKAGVGDLDVRWLIDGALHPKPRGGGGRGGGAPAASAVATRRPCGSGSQSMTDPAARLRDLDRAGIDTQVMLPTLMNSRLTDDVEFEAALVAAYNTWLGERCRVDSHRLKWAAILPLRTPHRAALEVRRARELGAACVT